MASNKYKLFEVTLNGNVYVKVESDFPSEMFAAALLSMNLTEIMTASSPSMTLNFVDAFGDLINHSYLTPEVSYDVYFGKSSTDNTKSSFSLSVNRAESMTPGVIENVGTSVNFLRHNWYKMVSRGISRSWTGSRYSDAVKDIATDSGFDKVLVESTDKSHNIIQPGWTNYQMLQWIAEHARSDKGVAGYDLAVTLDGRFTFQTFNSFYQQKPYGDYILVNPEIDNKLDETQLYSMSMMQEYSPVMTHGGFGAHYSYFDYENKQFVSKDLTIADTKQSQLSDWYFLPKDHLDPSNRIVCGRDTDAENTAENSIVQHTNSVQSMKVAILGDSNIHIGHVVNVLLAPDRASKKVINEMYSGYWMVSKVNHKIDFQNHNFVTQLTLSRAGINGKHIGNDYPIDNLAKSQVGKKIVA